MAKEKKKETEDWIQKKWRPMMAVMYMVVCIFDFIVFPIGFTIVQFWETQAANDAFRQWQPLTLVGAGLFHMAMGAVLGISAWSRGQEKMQGVASGSSGILNPASFNQPQLNTMQPEFSSNNYYQQQPHTRSYEQSYDTVSVAPVNAGYKGKKAPEQPADPVL